MKNAQEQTNSAGTHNQYEFDVEVGKILNLMINSLYTNKDVALRELISNASDACDKLRYLALQNPKLGNEEELKVTISNNSKAKTLIVQDNGIGMDKEDLIENLGKIAHSGTENFIKSLTGDNKKDVQLIGQFGVGFYSAFMIANEVEVISRKAGEDKTYCWKSAGQGNFTIDEIESEIQNGTKIILHLKDEAKEFLNNFHIQNVVETYSDHIDIKIELIDETGKTETINSSGAIWTKSPKDITAEQYQEFYKHNSHLPGEPFMTIHNKVEGVLEYTNLLFIPSMKPFDLFHPDRKGRVKLYVKKVFISEELELVPAWLRFMRGIIDSQDLPLNISRETLQHNLVLEKIKTAIIKKILSELKKKSEENEESYIKFWNDLGAVVKEGLCEPNNFKDKIFEISRFYTSKSPDKLVSLKEYFENLKENQDKIYYITAESIEKAKVSPQLEGFLSKDIEVLFLTDPVDEFWVTVNHTYQDKEFQSVTRADIDLGEIGQKSDETTKNDKTEDNLKDATDSQFDDLKKLIKEVLQDNIKDVRISKKLTDSPVCLAVESGAMDIRMERYLVEQKQILSASSKILEINSHHNIIKNLSQNLKNEAKKDENILIIKTLFDQACIIEGEAILDNKDFSQRLVKLMTNAFAN